jgi:hypothetical protein
MKDLYYTDSLFLAYIKFHYGRGIRELISVARNLLWFVVHFFSFSLLVRTLFSPWRRLGESYGSLFNLQAFFSVFVVNVLMRVVGFVTRTVVLSIGCAAYVGVLVLSLCVALMWLIAPLLFVGLIVLSITFFAV